jgi:hypothetical protein
MFFVQSRKAQPRSDIPGWQRSHTGVYNTYDTILMNTYCRGFYTTYFIVFLYITVYNFT